MDPIRDHSIEVRPGMTADELLDALGRNGVMLRIVRDGRVVGVLVRTIEENAVSTRPDGNGLDTLLKRLDALPCEGSYDDGIVTSSDRDEILYGS